MTREEVIKWFRESPFYHKDHEPFNVAIKALEQEPKTAHWIHHKEVLYESAEHWECSNCHKSTMTDPAYPHNDFNHMYFCPKCGAKMESEVSDADSN